uniref:Putative tick transposon n=1 Tax=Ixodes ricinus TaxID=34613 RepID=A0A6B0V817_IXORI
MTRINVQRLHRVFAVFIWGSVWERCARTNLFRSVRSGGLGLSHLFIRQIVSRFMFLRDQNHYFLRTVMQVRLRNVLPNFVVSTSDVICAGPRGYLREVLLSFRILSVRFSFDYLSSVRRKKLYNDLVDVFLPVPLYRTLYSEGPGLDVLKRVKRMPVKPSIKSFFFKLHSGTLPVKPWLAAKGIYVPWSVNCLLCKKPETIEHVFIECWDAVFHWDILQRTIKKTLPINPRGIRFLPVENEGGVPSDMFMVLSLHSIWKTRMGVRHAEANVRPVRENFIESVAYIREVYRQLPEPPDWMSLLDECVSLKEF